MMVRTRMMVRVRKRVRVRVRVVVSQGVLAKADQVKSREAEQRRRDLVEPMKTALTPTTANHMS